jgi:hypothetical protein
LRGQALREFLDRFFAAFPDVSFEILGVSGSDDRLSVEWLMRGANTGPLQPGLPPTGASVALPGIDMFELDGGAIKSVHGYFDQKTLLEQVGLQVIAQPSAVGPLRFGRAVWLSMGSRVKPKAFSTTWIDVSTDADRDEVIERSRQVFTEMVKMPGFIGATFTNVAGRLTTQTAWDSVESAHSIVKLMTHKEALKRFFSGDLGVAVHTAVWAPERQNPLWVRCAACGRIEEHKPGGRSACGEPFPDQPSYW